MLNVKTSCVGGHMQIGIDQQRFFLSPEKLKSPSQELWQIPVCLMTAGSSNGECILIHEKTVNVSQQGCPEWIFANRNAEGYYRVAYPPDALRAITRVAETKLNGPERIALIEDAWAMTRAGKTSAAAFLDLAQSLRGEQQSSVLDLLARHLDYVGDSLVAPEQAGKYRTLIGEQFARLARSLGWSARPDDSYEQKALRSTLLRILGEAGDPDAIAAARRFVQEYLGNPASIEGTIADSALRVAAENGDAQLYDELSEALPKAKSADDYYRRLYALAEFRQPALVNKTIALIDAGKIRKQDYPILFNVLLARPASRQPAWSYLKAHWDSLAENVTSFGGSGAITGLRSFCSVELREDVKGFFSQHHAPGAERALHESLESMDNCIGFKQLQQNSVKNWLAAQSGGGRIPE
jgi:aminopeptidase N